VLRRLVTGGHGDFGGGGMPKRIKVSSRSAPAVAHDRGGIVRKNARHGRRIADVPKLTQQREIAAYKWVHPDDDERR
jgi:hypothetical protein